MNVVRLHVTFDIAADFNSPTLGKSNSYPFMKTFSKDNLCLLVGANIRRIRLANHTTIEQLAFELGIEYTQLSRIERGKINTSVYQVFIISRALKVPIADLFGQVQSQVLE